MTQIEEKHTMFTDQKNQYSENEYNTKAIYRFNAILSSYQPVFFTELEQIISHLYGNTKTLE